MNWVDSSMPTSAEQDAVIHKTPCGTARVRESGANERAQDIRHL